MSKLAWAQHFFVKTKICCDLASLVSAFGVLILFVVLCNPEAPFEQDHIAKGAKISFLSETPTTVLDPLAGPCDFYRDEMFSFYYIVASIGYRVFGGNVFGYSNYLAAVTGAIFIYFILRVARKVHQTPWWVGLFIFLSMPLTVQTFTYGNEASFSLLFLSIALWSLTFTAKISWAWAGLVFAAGIFSRPDLVLWLPWVSLWAVLQRPTEESLVLRLRQLAWFWGALILGGAAYWLIFLRKFPAEVSFHYGFNPKLFIAYLTYPFCPPLLLLVILGGVIWSKKSILHAATLILVLLPIIYYARMLSSPKYISPILPMIGFLGCYGWQMGSRWLRWFVSGGVLSFFFFSLTPYGLFASPRGAFWHLPTADGPTPTGCYASFYKISQQGFFQERYTEELATVQPAVAYHRKNPTVPLVGYFNPQTIMWNWVQNKPRTTSPLSVKVFVDEFPEAAATSVMARISYLRVNTFKPEFQTQFKELLHKGCVQAIDDTVEPFPKNILIGGGISPGTDQELGARILFSLARSKGTGMVPRSRFCLDFGAICWLPKVMAAPFERAGYAPIYKDSQFTAFNEALDGGIFYSALMPLIYYQESDPRDQVHGNH